ncbi:DUF262 domain-containing protein [Moraxella pluranimalium]|uniref:Uncharacterized protein n=1 Tax=Moraxella pluranimalium TaxID=470453 RepID=A0A1T0CQW1_9GAMM|nr:DUF262 domain-containing protein [Moraxella pluranimalium]OOS24727.1 hypothetical protein B0680_04720 [Moraxella pluranimalium]
MSDSAQVTIETVSKIFEKPLTIPEYQRPYKWQTKHVKQLVDDIHSYFKKQDDKADDKADDNTKCRLGTIVLHYYKDDKDVGRYDIVDGQQRLTSLFLLLYVLNNKENPFNNKFLEQEFNHTQSMVNIRKNHQFLQSYIKELGDEKYRADFKAYILHSCDFAVVVLDNLDEAFQYFDSQNSRGKSLEAYDLLKAYHLREMGDVCDVYRLVETWERNATMKADAPNQPVWLKLIINDILFRYRRWELKMSAEFFKKQDVDIFKGLSRQKQQNFLKLFKRYAHEIQMNGVILDGEQFFEYIEHYKAQYETLFADGGLVNNHPKIVIPNTQTRLFRHLKQHSTINKGDGFVFMLFVIMVMRYYDKFGGYRLDKAVVKIARWAYFLRFYHKSIYFSSVENHLWEANGLYVALQQAIEPEQFLSFNIGKTEKRTASKNVNYLNDLLEGFYDDKTQSDTGENP